MTPSGTTIASRAAADLRRAFLDFFVARGHTLVSSAPLVPNDPTLLFTTAGMVQFKPYYTAADVPYTRAVSVQKCLRLTDLENVGTTPRHCTFFEMLGNFSFGPREKGAYFKDEAIATAWEFVTRVLGLPKSRLYASIFAGEGKLPRDDEAEALWKKMGLPSDQIVALGRADNFWGPAGGQGPCGPCSEIYFDLGEKRPAYLAEGAFWGERPGDPGDRYMEFWNLVFPQFDAQKDGSLVPLARPGIDTGMGLERLALLIQEKSIVFETDLLEPLVTAVLDQARPPAERRGAALRDARIIADHTRALTFAIAEGALPGNEGAGYVLRRLLRRAVTRGRSGRGLALHDRYLITGLAEKVRAMYGGHYAELLRRDPDVIHSVLAREEEHFTQTYEGGFALLESLIETSGGRIPGERAFELHDTYGFPVELTEEIAAERGVHVDMEGFQRAMEEQRKRARAASKFHKSEGERAVPWTEASSGADSAFLGYEVLTADGISLRRWRRTDGSEVEVTLDRTPFYAESGGQVADRGVIEGGDASTDVVHVYREGESIVHRVRLRDGADVTAVAKGSLRAAVDPAHRNPTMRHHTATHMLHAALRRILGDHVRQAGSLVAPDRLRFDYNHFEAPRGDQIEAIERMVSEWALRNTAVSWEVMPLDQAKGLGAMALFGEKYGSQVRVVTVEGVEDAGIAVSRELCGGTHVSRTGDIGAFVLLSDTTIASGVRRIEALCGHEATGWLKAQAETLARAAATLQVRPEAVPEQTEKLKSELERLRRAEADSKRGGLEAEMARLAEGASTAPGGRWVAARIETDADANAVRDAADRLRGALKRGAAVLAVSAGGKLTFVAAVTDDLVAEKKLNAADLVKKVAQVTGGSGGGKPHLALAGGKDVAKLEDALAEARRLLAEALGSVKALILAGGRGTRLRPITHTSAKQLVPVANKPVLFYGLEAVRDAGITDVGIVVSDPRELLAPDHRTGEQVTVMVNSQAEIRAAVGDGKAFGLRISYIEQAAPLGLAHAVKISEEYMSGEPFVMYLGDNLIKDGIAAFVREFESERPDAQILLAKVNNPSDFGVAELDGERVVRLEEKPPRPRSDLALVGVYLFSDCVFDAVKAIRPSARGELEITDAIQHLISSGRKVRSHVISGWWKDTGKVEDLLEANRIVLGGLAHEIRGTVDRESRVERPVSIGPGTVIERSRLRGPLIIGANARIRDATIGPYTAIGDEVSIVGSDIEHSIVLERSRIEAVPVRIESSLIGKEVVITASSEPSRRRLMVGDSSRVELA